MSPNFSWLFHLGAYPCGRIGTTSCILVWKYCPNASHKLHFDDARGPPSNLSIDLPRDMEVL